MSNFITIHGITLADNSYIENFAIEQLASDPVAVNAGQVWYNTTEKTIKYSTLNTEGAVVVETIASKSELDSAVAALQGELDGTQTGAGLETDGSYSANGLANYIAAATSLKDADEKLDAQVKVNADGLAQEIVDRTDADTALDGRLTTVEDQVNGKIGDLTTLATDEKSSLVAAINEVQTELDNADSAINDAVSGVQAELDATQAGAGLGTDGAYTANASANYIAAATSLTDADNKLDAQVKANADALAQEVIDRETADATKLALAGGTMTGGINMGENKISGLADPIDDSDAATKGYVDSVAQGLDVKASVRVATTENVDLATGGLLTVDGVVLAEGDRVLVKNQTTASENGIYVAAAGAWVRSEDANINTEVTSGMFTFVEEGTAGGNNGYVLVTDGSITLGTTDLEFEQFSGAGQIIAGAGISKSGNELYLNFGAGVAELPNDEIGIETTDGLFTTEDGSTESTAAAAKLGVKIDGETLSKSIAGLRVAQGVLDDISANAAAIAQESTDRANADSAIQAELDASQTGAGLETDGTYASNTSANYIAAATSLKDADNKLDAAVKAEADRAQAVEGSLTSLVTDDKTDLVSAINEVSSLAGNGVEGVQNELDATQVGAGLAESGAYAPNVSANYIAAATSLADADNKLDAQVKVNADAIAQEAVDRADAVTAEETRATGEEARIEAKVDQEIADRASADTAIRSDVNALRYAETTSTPALSHSIIHNLGSGNLIINVMVEQDDSSWANDIVPVKEVSNNQFDVFLTEARNIKVAVMSMSDI